MHPGRYPEAVIVRLLCIAFALFAFNQSAASDEKRGHEGTPQEQHSALLADYSHVSRGLRDANSDFERKAAVERMSAHSSNFIALAARHPQDPVALTALRQAVQIIASTDSAALQTWEMNSSHYPTGSIDGSAAKSTKLVFRDHLLSQELGPVIDRMRYCYRLEFEACLRTVLEKNPHHEVQGLACLALAQYLRDKWYMLHLVEERPELVRCYEMVFGSDYLPALKQLGRDNLADRIEVLFERAIREYPDGKFWGTTIGETTRSELYDIRNLSVGNMAPEIEGKDQDGKPLSLSDLRGQVVLLYFWSEL